MNFSPTQQANIEFHRRLAQNYEDQPFFHPENRKRVRELLSAFSRDAGNQRLLDVGCGTGFIFDQAHDLFQQMEGIDITPDMLARVTPRGNLTLRVGEAENLPFPPSSFDVVTCYSVLHHIEDLQAVFVEIRRVLKPGGVFYADESPSQQYRELLLQNSGRLVKHPFLKAELCTVANDAEHYESRYGISQEITRQAMVQNYDKGLLSEENLRKMLADVGFEKVRIEYRRFLSQTSLEEKFGSQYGNAVEHYLKEMLPLSRAFFKYFVLVAQ
jgi:ubiquinone/menaquinone biosynthesis C-methylase UbiE